MKFKEKSIISNVLYKKTTQGMTYAWYSLLLIYNPRLGYAACQFIVFSSKAINSCQVKQVIPMVIDYELVGL